MSFERLEERQLMAVTTSLAGGSLTITGDDAADDIAIVGTARAGELVVTGRNGTMVNGVPNGRARAYPVHVASPNVLVQDVALSINTAGGNDKVSIDNAIIGGSLSIAMADDDDNLRLGQSGPVIIGGDCSIRTGAGNDRFSEGNYSVSSTGGRAISLEDGNDTATLMGGYGGGRVFPLGFGISGINVSGGAGNDSILATHLDTPYSVWLHGATGANSLALLYSSAMFLSVIVSYDADIYNFPGVNTFYLDTNYARGSISVITEFAFGVPATNPRDSTVNILACRSTVMAIALGYGRNLVNVYANAINGPPFTVFGGEPSPRGPELVIVGYSGPVTGPSAGLVSDIVSASYNIAVEVDILLGSGNDLLSLAGNFVSTSTTLDSGLGRNIFGERDNYFGRLTKRNLG